MLQRISRSVATAQYNARRYGWEWAIRSAIFSKLGARELSVRTPALPHPVSCRLVSTDIYEFSHLLGRNAPDIRLPIVPQYIVDAGANAGYSVLRFHSEFPNAKIVAVEPEAGNVAQIRKNIAPYPNISVESAALWTRSTKLKITIPEIDHNAFQVVESDDGSVEGLTVRDIMNRHHFPRIDLLKIDIEGSEKELFQAPDSGDWIKDVRMILVETHDRFKEGCTAAIETATKGQLEFRGMVGEYRLYVPQSVARREGVA